MTGPGNEHDTPAVSVRRANDCATRPDEDMSATCMFLAHMSLLCVVCLWYDLITLARLIKEI